VFRIDKVNEEIRHQVSMILQRDIHDSRIGFVTIIKVDTSPDLKSADIFFTCIKQNGVSDEDTLKALKAKTGLIRGFLAKRIRLKFLPRITFIQDDSGVISNRIDEIIDIIHKDKEIMDGD